MILYGKNSVYERLKANPKSIRKILLADNFSQPDIEALIATRNIAVERLSLKQLTILAHTQNPQGIIAKVEKFTYSPFDDLLSQSRSPQLSLIFLDRIYDPQNLGAIIRTSACMGGFAIVIPKFKACEVSDTVLHVAQGGENYVPISMVSNLSNALISAKKGGYWVVGAVTDDEAENVYTHSFPFPLALVLGSEGRGVRYGVRKHLDVKVRIPAKGAQLSLNVNAACAIFCHEIAKQRANPR
ncbi:MAG: 23S rRNA (guanosine(2251)-2'-O)-methyltransferase RlmB [Candidatus Omnitrophota bacterium]|nr:MAG: 23S rRNA (guanosine(2251)-2'-O)-methyltransferase RlmB [Candidatus Omnitrophota bacterium]